MINTERNITLFYYYSTRKFPDNCYLDISNDLAHRNLFLFKNNQGKIHFEFPVFENHSYNSICNRLGVRSLIKKKGNDKYIIFRTMDNDIKKRYIIGYYKVGKIFYQETKLFNNNGFVCGFETSETKLLKRGDITFSDKSIGIGHNVSWHNEKWNSKLNSFLDKIINFGEDSSDLYQKETNNIISLFKDENKIREWKEHCEVCQNNKKCYFYKYNKRYVKKNSTPNMFELIHAVYNSNLYSKNELDVIKKKYIR